MQSIYAKFPQVRKEVRLGFRVNKDFLNLMEARASEEGINISEFIRRELKKAVSR